MVPKRDFLNLDFWISEFLVLILSNYYRWMEQWDLAGIIIAASIFLITGQYCILHAKEMRRKIAWPYIILLEISYTLANLYITLSNMFWFTRSYQTNLLFVLILTVILCPMITLNSKFLKKR